MSTKRDVFISYHTSTAKHIVEEIGRKLEAHGITCWYAPRDCEGAYASAIMEGLNNALIFLIIVNKGAMDSEHVKNEIDVAFARYSSRAMKLMVFQVDDYPLDNDFRYYLGRIHRIAATVPPITDKIDELVNRILYVKQTAQDCGAIATDSVTRIVSATITPDSSFVGRQREMEEIYSFLRQNKKIFVSGMGGIGKSQLLRQFAVKYKNEFRTISWATYDTSLKDLIVSDTAVKISNFANVAGAEDKESYFKRKCNFLTENCNEDDLLIVDNYNAEFDQDLEIVTSLPMSIIFTSRLTHRHNNYVLKQLDNDEDLYRLFLTGYPRALTAENEKIVRDIISKLNGHTLSIKLISNLMREKRLRPADVLEMLQKSVVDVLDSATPDQTRAEHAISDMFKLADLSVTEKNVMYNLAFVPVSGLDAADFFDYCKLENYDAVDGLIDKNWILHDSATDFISLHPIVCDLCLEKIPYSDNVVCNFVCAIVEMLNKSKFCNFEKKNWLLAVKDNLFKVVPCLSPLYGKLVMATVRLLHTLSKHDEIIELITQYLPFETDAKLKFSAYSQLATAYRCKEEPEGLKTSIIAATELLEQCDFSDGERALATSELSSLRGWYYWLLSDYENAATHFRRKLDIDLVYNKDHIQELGWGYFNVALAEAYLKRFDTCFDGFKKAIELFESIDLNFGVGCTYNSMASAYRDSGDFVKMEKCASKSAELLKSCVGEMQIDTANAYRLLFLANRELGNIRLAEEYREKYHNVLKQLNATNVLRRWMAAE